MSKLDEVNEVNTILKPGKSAYQISRSKVIARTLGIYTAARYLNLRGWSLESALWILCGVEIKEKEIKEKEIILCS